MTTWTPAAEDSETWAENPAHRRRIFSPSTFQAWPVFATGVLSDFWTEETKQAETWTPE